jgi:low temperature requirement protein LtrA
VRKVFAPHVLHGSAPGVRDPVFVSVSGAVLRRRGAEQSPAVTNTELFFDLVYVFAVTQLSHRLAEHLTGWGAVETLVLFLAVWWAWNYTAWATNWIDPNHRGVQVLIVVLMLASLVMSAAIPEAFADQAIEFAAAYVGLQVVRSAFMVTAFDRGDRMKRNFAQLLAWTAIAGVAWLVGSFLPSQARLAVWIVALLIDYLAPLHGFALPVAGRTPMSDWTLAGGHLAERMQLFVIIALGESLLAVGAAFSGLHRSGPVVVAFVIGFIANVSLWAIYFVRGGEQAADAIASAADPARAGRGGYAYAHAIMVAGIIVVAVAIELTSAHPLGHTPVATAAVILAGPALYLAGNTLFNTFVTEQLPWSRLAGIGVLALLIPAAPVVSPLVLLLLATLVTLVLALTAGTSRLPHPGNSGLQRKPE